MTRALPRAVVSAFRFKLASVVFPKGTVFPFEVKRMYTSISAIRLVGETSDLAYVIESVMHEDEGTSLESELAEVAATHLAIFVYTPKMKLTAVFVGDNVTAPIPFIAFDASDSGVARDGCFWYPGRGLRRVPTTFAPCELASIALADEPTKGREEIS